MTDPVTLPAFKPRKPGSHLFEWEQASLHAEQQFPKHPGVTEFVFVVDYTRGKAEESFVKGCRVHRVAAVDVFDGWAYEVGRAADAEAKKLRLSREGWSAGEE